MRSAWMAILAGCVTAAAALAQTAKAPAGCWPTYNRDLADTRYSPLTQINTKNVANLNRATPTR